VLIYKKIILNFWPTGENKMKPASLILCLMISTLNYCSSPQSALFQSYMSQPEIQHPTQKTISPKKNSTIQTDAILHACVAQRLYQYMDPLYKKLWQEESDGINKMREDIITERKKIIRLQTQAILEKQRKKEEDDFYKEWHVIEHPTAATAPVFSTTTTETSFVRAATETTKDIVSYFFKR
jgi:hypothetical protein